MGGCLQPSAVSASEEEGRRGERTTAERKENGRNTASVHLLVMKRPGERKAGELARAKLTPTGLNLVLHS